MTAALSMTLATLAALASCERPRREGPSPNATAFSRPMPPPPPTPAPTAGKAIAPLPAGAMRAPPPPGPPPRQPGQNAAPPPPQPKPAAPLSASLRAFGLRAPSVPRIAEDYSLGPLQSYRPAEGDESAVFSLAKAFLDKLGGGKIDKSLLLPGARDALAVILASLAQKPAAADNEGSSSGSPYRLGAIEIQGAEASLRLRLPSPSGSGRREGLLSLRKAEDSWYVEALVMDPPASGALAFNPDTSARPR